MAYQCELCGKGYQRGHRVSHAKNRMLRRFKPNLHRMRIMEASQTVRRLICTRCLKQADRPSKKKKISEKRPLAFTSA